MSVTIKDITNAFAEMRITASEETYSEEQRIEHLSIPERRVYFFNKFMNKSPKRLGDETKSYERRLKEITERFLDFRQITFDCTHVYKFLEELADFAALADKKQCFDKERFRNTYKKLVTQLFENALSPVVALQKGESLKELSDKIIMKLITVATFYKNLQELGIDDIKICPDKIRCKLVGDYSGLIKRIERQFTTVSEKESKPGLITWKNQLLAEVLRLRQDISKKSLRKAASKTIKNLKHTQTVGRIAQEMYLKGKGKTLRLASGSIDDRLKFAKNAYLHQSLGSMTCSYFMGDLMS